MTLVLYRESTDEIAEAYCEERSGLWYLGINDFDMLQGFFTVTQFMDAGFEVIGEL